MGYPIDKIGANTALFSIVGQNAIENKNDIVFNSYFKKMDVDCKMMPLNIRHDDIGFFLNGLKNSQIKAVYFEKDYWQIVASLLETGDEEINFCGICDTMDIKNGNYNMRLSIGKSILNLVDNIKDSTIVLIGSSGVAKSVLYNLIKKRPKKIILAHNIVEELIDMMNMIPKDIKHDIQRVTDNNLSFDYDVSINCTNLNINSNIDINRDFGKILDNIAKTNTKDWSKNG